MVDVRALFSELDRIGVPNAYVDELEEIYFTMLPNDHGDYLSGRVRISCAKITRPIMARVLVHELAHHIDDEEEISGKKSIRIEKRKMGKYMPPDARQNLAEYVALGFEIYYFGTKKERGLMRKMNHNLWSSIEQIHRKYSKR